MALSFQRENYNLYIYIYSIYRQGPPTPVNWGDLRHRLDKQISRGFGHNIIILLFFFFLCGETKKKKEKRKSKKIIK